MIAPWDMATRLRHMAVDSECSKLAGIYLATAEQLDCLSRIHAELDGQEWDSETAGRIAEHLSRIGLECSEPGEDEEQPE